MPIGLVGRKCGMTRIFTEAGESIPVTVIEARPNRVATVRTDERDGYRAVQVTVGVRSAARLPKAEAGHFAANKIEPGEGLWEFRLDAAEGKELAPGSEIKVDLFKPGQRVNVAGISKGKGFAGTIKRHHFAGQDRSHGNSRSHRVPGSIGQRQTPGRVFPGKRMSGQLGNTRRSAENLEVVRVDAERNLILVRGAVPGAASGRVIIVPAGKSA